MPKTTCRAWLISFGFALTAALSPAPAYAGMGGIDHLADNLSITDFWVNGAGGFQAGTGNAGAPSPALPEKWHPGLTAHVVWDVRDWEHDTGKTYEADVPIEPYGEDGGRVWVHFLANGDVRVVVSNVGPSAPNYPGPHDPIPQKEPSDMYPARHDWRDTNEHLADIAIARQRCAAAPDIDRCMKQVREEVLDDQREDARRYLPRCARITTGPAYQACKRDAWEKMRAARHVRRCQAAPHLAECISKKTKEPTSKTAETTGAPSQ